MAVEVSALGLNCQDCQTKPELQKFRGCFKPTERVQYVVDGKNIYRCPAKYIRPDVKDFINMYADYKKGYLPFRGTKSEQPIKLMEIFDILELAEIHQSKEKQI